MRPAIRPFMQRRIDALHAEIARLVQVEKAWNFRTFPEPSNTMRQVTACRIDVAAWEPNRKRNVWNG